MSQRAPLLAGNVPDASAPLHRARLTTTLLLVVALVLSAPSVARADPDYDVLFGGIFGVVVGVPATILLMVALLWSRAVREVTAAVVVIAACVSIAVWIVPARAWLVAWMEGEITTWRATEAAESSTQELDWSPRQYGIVPLALAQAADWPLDDADLERVRDPSRVAPTIDGSLFVRPGGGAYLDTNLSRRRLFSLEQRLEGSHPPRLRGYTAIHTDARLASTGDEIIIASTAGVELRSASLALTARAAAVDDISQIAAADGVLWLLRPEEDGAALHRETSSLPTQSVTLRRAFSRIARRADGVLVVGGDGALAAIDPTTLALIRPSPLVALTNRFEPWQLLRLAWTLPASITLMAIAAALAQRARSRVGSGDDPTALDPPLTARALRQRVLRWVAPAALALLLVHGAVLHAVL